MSEFEIDWEREGRTGLAEALMCEWKTPSQIEAIVASTGERRMLLTRLDLGKLDSLSETVRRSLDYDCLSRTAVLGGIKEGTPIEGAVGIVCAGTSDLPVAREAVRTLAFFGYGGTLVTDVGVAGLWRLMGRLDEIRAFKVVIAVAGMEGALFSVLSGLVEAPVIAVPTAVGYGVAAGGRTALSAALSSCSPGLVVVNIDNGYGAACAALKILRLTVHS